VREDPIYEVLRPRECLIMVKSDSQFLVARNVDGSVMLEWVKELGESCPIQPSFPIRASETPPPERPPS